MARTPTGSLGTHFTGEVTTLARLLSITRRDNERLLLTDHDKDLRIPAKDLTAAGDFTFTETIGGARRATGILSIGATFNAVDGETVTIGTTVYRFKNTTLAAFDVNIGADRDISLVSLGKAINLTGTVGVDYHAGTTIHPDVFAVGPDLTAEGVQISQGTGSAIGTLTFTGNGKAFDGSFGWWGCCAALGNAGNNTGHIGKNYTGSAKNIHSAIVYGAKLEGSGTGGPDAGDLYGGWWFGGTTTMVLELRGAIGAFPGRTGGTLLGTTGSFLDNHQGVRVTPPQNKVIFSDNHVSSWDHVWINMVSGGAPANGVAGRLGMGEVEFFAPAVIPAGGELAVSAKVAGFAGNLIATTETMANGSWGAVTLTGGADAFVQPLDTETVTIGTQTYTFEVVFTDTQDFILIGADAAETAANLVVAIENGAGEGTVYGTGTLANTFATANVTGISNNVVTVTAILSGDIGNTVVTTDTATGIGFEFATLTGGDDGLFLSRPGFTASSALSSSAQGIEGLEIKTVEGTSLITQDNIRRGVYAEAQCALEYVDWAETPTIVGTMVLFAGVMGEITVDDDDNLSFEIMGKFSRNRTVRINTYQPNCRADLGDAECKIPIDDLKQTFTISAVTNSFTFETGSLVGPDDEFKLGIVHFLTGDNAGVAIEVSSSAQTNGAVTLFLPAPLAMQVGDTGEIFPGCDKTLETCITRYNNVINFRGEPFAPQESSLFAFKG